MTRGPTSATPPLLRWLGRHAGLASLLLAAPRLATAGPDAAPQVGLVPVTMHVGFTSTVFLQSNRNDVEAAFKALGEIIGRKRGFAVTVKPQYFRDAAAFQEAIDAGRVNFALFDSLTYAALPRLGDLTPAFITASAGTTGRSYLLLVRRDSGLRRLEDLRGRSIIELQAPNLSLGHTWLLDLLLAQRVARHEDFFRLIEHVARPAAAVLPVFFGRADACLVDDLGFKLMVELNPQVGRVLEPIATSAPLVGAVLAISESHWSSPEFRPRLMETLADLHREPAGRQLLALFKVDQLVPYQETQLTSVRGLWTSYTRRRQEPAP